MTTAEAGGMVDGASEERSGDEAVSGTGMGAMVMMLAMRRRWRWRWRGDEDGDGDGDRGDESRWSSRKKRTADVRGRFEVFGFFGRRRKGGGLDA